MNEEYKLYRNLMKQHKNWFWFFIGYVIFGGIWFIYSIISEPTIKSVLFLMFYLLILIINFKHIKEMKSRYIEYEKKCKEILVENLENENKQRN